MINIYLQKEVDGEEIAEQISAEKAIDLMIGAGFVLAFDAISILQSGNGIKTSEGTIFATEV